MLGEDPRPEVLQVATPPDVSGEVRIATTPDRIEAVRAPVIDSPLPAGEPILRDCFGDTRKEVSIGYSGGTTGRGGGGPPSPAKPARDARNPQSVALPGPGDAKGKTDPGNLGAARDGAAASAPLAEPVGGLPKLKKKAEAAEKRTQTTPATPAANEPSQGAEGGEAMLEQLGYLEDDRQRTVDAEQEKDAAGAKRQSQVVQPVVDWGATVYLSNDDSMSLASAQRLLYAMSRDVALSPAEIRPHELLNYFSFDTVAPPENQTFGVLGAAEQQGDTLTVSLAVRGANPARQPLDLTVLLDRSGSMSAEDRMSYTKRGLTLLSGNLQRGDRVDVVLFDTDVCTPLENFVIGRDDPALLTAVISQLQPTGSTNLDAGLTEAYRVQTSRDAAETHGRNRRVLLVTDADLNTGNVSEALVSEVGAKLDQHGIRLSGIGVGRTFNDSMLDLLTEKGRGAYVYLGSEAVVDRIFGPGFDSLVRTVAHDVQFSIDLPPSLAMEKFYGEEASTDAADVDPIHYHAGTTQLFLQDLKVRGGQVVPNDPIVMRIAYRDATTMEPQTQELRTTVGALLDADPHNLHKGQALMAFADLVTAKAMGAEACGAPLAAYRARSATVADDAEIGFVNGLVGRTCGVELATVVSAGVELKVRVDSDIPISRIELACGDRSHLEPLSGADTIARFQSVQPGSCTVKLDGTTPMAARVEVPETGGDLRCTIRGGRISCG